MMTVMEAEAGRLPAFATDYWTQSRRPLASLLFVLPLLLFYELGMLWLGPEATRNGADVWMQQVLRWIGFGGHLLLPILTIGILLGWHHMTAQPWRVARPVFYTMAAEVVLLALLLVAIAHLHASLLSIAGGPVECAWMDTGLGRDYLSRLLRFFGAGIYEEMLFRLMLVPLTVALVGLAIASRHARLAAALVVTSLIFSAAHYVGPCGETYNTYTFAFRILAGGFFAFLFLVRGFGIAAGTHACYDVLVGFPAP